ncbi:MAG: hypothetical protein ISS49_17340 [Anaerolineae bacterium]|nr:hypothetical protein [Anaerolineae bacterium]
MMNNRLEPLEDVVGDLFVDRHYELDMFWKWATSIPRRMGNSYVLVGRRRTGKTAILVKLFNRLFYEQEAVLPVYISFARYMDRKEPITSFDFAHEYFTGYVGCYLAFRHRRPALLRQRLDLQQLRRFARQAQDEYVLDLCRQYDESVADSTVTPHGLVQWVIHLPMGQAAVRNVPTAMIVDEFQVLTNVYDPVQEIYHDVTDSFQWAVETRWAPMLVSGSAVTLLVEQALTGMLSGRFHYWYLKPLAREYAHDLVFRLAASEDLTATEELAEAVWRLTEGYPYSIYGLMTSVCPARQRYPDPDALEQVLTFELTDPQGELWKHYDTGFRKYSERLNTSQVTKKVMFWATKYPEEQIDAERVAQEVGVDVDAVQNALDKLHEADIVTRIGWTLYQGPGDPMLRRYIAYNHRREIEKLAPAEAVKDWEREYKRLRGHMSNFVGEVAEVYIQAVMRTFDGREVGGDAYFNYGEPVTLPAFETIERRGGIVKAGVPIEIDLAGEWTLPPTGEEAEGGRGAWLVQVKFTEAPVGEDDVRRFLEQTDAVVQEKGYQTVTRWYFCKRGYTAGAVQALQQAGVLFSDRAGFNGLANLFGFFGLPK